MSSEQVVLLSARVDSLFSFTDDDFVSEHFVCSENDDAPMFSPNEDAPVIFLTVALTLSLTLATPMSCDVCCEIRRLISLSDEMDEDRSRAT